MYQRQIPTPSDLAARALAEPQFHEDLHPTMDARAVNAHAGRYVASALSDWCHEHNQPLPDALPLPEWTRALVYAAVDDLTQLALTELEMRAHEEALAHPYCVWFRSDDGRTVPFVPYQWRE